MILYCLHEQATLVPQPDRPRETGLGGDVLPLQSVCLHQELGYLQLCLKCSHAAARTGLRQAVQVVQPGFEDSEALREGSVYLLTAPLTRPLLPGIGERLGWP